MLGRSRTFRAVELPRERPSKFCKTSLRGYAENEIQGRRSKREIYEGNTQRPDSYHFVAGWGSILVLASASVSSGRAGVPDSPRTVGACRTRMDRRRAPSLPSHCAGNPPCTLRVVYGIGATLPVAIRL